MTDIIARFNSLITADFLIIGLNVLLLVFAGPLALRLQKLAGSQAKRTRMLVMRFFSLMLIIAYALALLLGAYFGIDKSDCSGETCLARYYENLRDTGITLVVSYFAVFFGQSYVVRKFGRSREIEGETTHMHTYQSELLSMVILLLVIIIAFLSTLSIWEIDDLKQQTGVIGGTLLLLFITKDIWLPDNINGLILLYKSDVEPGSLVRVNALNLLAVTLRTSLTQTSFRDLVQRHRIIIPNSRFRDQKIEVLSAGPESGLVEFVDFKIGYDIAAADAEAFLCQVWKTACESENAINEEIEPRAFVLDTGDHAVTWRLRYVVKNIYRLMQARYAIFRTALEHSQQTGIELATPVTHVIVDGEMS